MFHKIKNVVPLNNLKLEVEFIDGSVKSYNINELMSKYKVFEELKNEELFKKVKVDQGGYGIIWNNKIDLACNELWEHGVSINKKD